MAKKQFTNSFQDIFSPTTPQAKEEKIVDVSEEMYDEIQRTTILLKSKTYDAIKAIAYWERCQIKDLIDKSLNSIINSYSKEDLSKILKEYNQNRQSS